MCENGCVDEAGGCVSCVDNSQCSNPAPYCAPSSHTCERCTLDADCLSAVCDEARGECVDSSMVVYAAPSGSATGNCGTQALPCSLERGFARLDQTLRILKLEPGEYAPPQGVSIGGTAIVHGWGATVRGEVTIEDPAQVQILGLTFMDASVAGGVAGGVTCQRTAGQPSLVLDRVKFQTSGSLQVFGCAVTIRRTHFALQGGGRPIFQVAAPTTAVTVDRTLFDGTGGGNGIYADGSIQITNSIFRNITSPISHPSGNQDRSRISFSTFINSPITCNGGPMTEYTNNIMYTVSGDAIVAPMDDLCSYSFDLMTSQSQPPTNSFMNKSGDPKFANVQAGDFHLLTGSPAIDAGNPFPTVLEDFDGTPRPQTSQIDIGAYEYKP